MTFYARFARLISDLSFGNVRLARTLADKGRLLGDLLQALEPALRCLFMSGYTADVVARHGVLEEGVAFIQKPFSMADLVNKVREVLA